MVFLHGTWNGDAWGSLNLQALYQQLDSFQAFGDTSVLTPTRLAMSNTLVHLGHQKDWLDGNLHLESYASTAQGLDLPQQALVPNSSAATLTRRRQNSTYFLGTELRYKFYDNSVIAGVDYYAAQHVGDEIWSETSQSNGSQQQLLINSPTSFNYSNLGVYAQGLVRPIESLGITAGLRYDDASRWNRSLSYRAAVTYSFLKNFSGKILLGSSFVPPPPVLLTAFAVRPGGVQGNPTLEPQNAQTIEVGLANRPVDFLFLHVNGFVTLITNRVEYIKNGFNAQAENLTQSFTAGGEAIVEFAAPPVSRRAELQHQRQQHHRTLAGPRLV